MTKKSVKRKRAASLKARGRQLFLDGLISAKDFDSITRIADKASRKLKS